jgi:hypothetical protein
MKIADKSLSTGRIFPEWPHSDAAILFVLG